MMIAKPRRPGHGRALRLVGTGSLLLGLGAAAGALLAQPAAPPTRAAPAFRPAPPPSHEMAFVVERFVPAFKPDPEACPTGAARNVKEVFLDSLPPAERERLQRKENGPEFDKRWRASVYGPNGINICSQPELFDHPMLRTVQSRRALGIDLDGDGAVKSCTHQSFTGFDGTPGVDNQAYRALGCSTQWWGKDGQGGDMPRGFGQFMASGEWTQVLILRGVDSIDNDPEVEVIYGNTPDRPMVDALGHFLPGASFAISDKPPRYRNVLKGRIVDGVLTTQPSDIKLTQTWGQGGARDIRGSRGIWDLRAARLKLRFQPDGTLEGLVGGYEPIFNLIQSAALGGAGSALDGQIDCAGELKTLRAMADGIRDPRTGQCGGVSNALAFKAVPAFVNDAPAKGIARE